MAEFIRMPSVMANATEAVLSAWLTSPGEMIAVGDPIAEIETDKAVVEYAAEVGGTVGRLLVEAGARVAVGAPIVVVLDEGEDESALPAPVPGGAAPGGLPGVPGAPQEAAPPSPSTPPAPAAPAMAASGSTVPDHDAAGTPRRFASPIARRMAMQRGIDLHLLTGTGPHGRIVRRDVEAYEPAQVPPATPLGGGVAPAVANYRDVPLSAMRRAIAQRLTESKSAVPHFYMRAQVRVDRLLAVRQEVNAQSPRRISVNDLVVKAVAVALVEVPAANANWNGDTIRYFQSVDVAVAVAVPNGLLTPVVRGVEQLGLLELSAQIARLTESARSGRLHQHELEGGSFTVSNLGMRGVDEFTAIINPPHAGILAVSAAKPAPVIDDDGQLAVGQVMTVTLSADHRVIDGALAADWMAVLVDRLQNPIVLLL